MLQHLLKVELVNPLAADRAKAVMLVALLERRNRVFHGRWFLPLAPLSKSGSRTPPPGITGEHSAKATIEVGQTVGLLRNSPWLTAAASMTASLSPVTILLMAGRRSCSQRIPVDRKPGALGRHARCRRQRRTGFQDYKKGLADCP